MGAAVGPDVRTGVGAAVRIGVGAAVGGGGVGRGVAAATTVMDPVIAGWIAQWYVMSPETANVIPADV